MLSESSAMETASPPNGPTSTSTPKDYPATPGDPPAPPPEPEAPANPAAAQATTVSVPVPRTWPETLDLATKLAVVLSVMAYASGFIVSVLHYARYGVPAWALQSQTFLAAGILCLTLTGLGIALGVAMRRMSTLANRNYKGRSMKVRFQRMTFKPIIVVVIVSLGGAFSLLLESADRMNFGVWFALIGFGSAIVAGPVKEPGKTLGLHHFFALNWQNKLGLGGVLFFGVFSFARLVYGTVPVHFGGGTMQLMTSVSLPRAAPAPARDAWLDVGCRSSSAPAKDQGICRRFFRVYENTEHVFLNIAEWAGPCGTPSWFAGGAVRGLDRLAGATPDLRGFRTRCFHRVANSSIPRLETAPPE
jgi:hypothetical protein